MTRKEREASAARLHAEETARDAGLEHFKNHPELLLADVWRRANKLYDEHYLPYAFVEGYTAGRKQRDEYLAERGPNVDQA